MSKFTNKAAFIVEQGKPLKVEAAEEPKADGNEVIIKNHAIAINPLDWKQQDYGFMIPRYPHVIGCDVAGEIVAVGDEVKQFAVGDRVIGHCIVLGTEKTKHAAFQQFTVLPTQRVAKLPANIKYEEGAVLPLAVSTAAVGLYKPGVEGLLGLKLPSLEPKPSGQVIVVYGASSSVGAATVQLAVASGASVIAIASKHNFDFVKSLGASQAFDYKDPQIVDHVVEAVKASGGKFAGIFDVIGEEDKSYDITVPIAEKLGGGNLATVLPPPKSLPANVKSSNFYAIDDATDPVWKDYITPALEQSKLRCLPRPEIVGTGLESIQKGMDANKKGVSAKKIVVTL